MTKTKPERAPEARESFVLLADADGIGERGEIRDLSAAEAEGLQGKVRTATSRDLAVAGQRTR